MTTPQSLSDAGHRDPARHIAAKLMRMAESWIDGTGRRWSLLAEMDQLVDTLRQTYAQELEQREAPEPVGVGMSDKVAMYSAVTVACWACGARHRLDEAHRCERKPQAAPAPTPHVLEQCTISRGFFPSGAGHHCGPTVLGSVRVGAEDLPVRINNVGCCVVSRFDLDRLPGRLVRVDCVTCGGWYAEGARYEDMPCGGKPATTDTAP